MHFCRVWWDLRPGITDLQIYCSVFLKGFLASRALGQGPSRKQCNSLHGEPVFMSFLSLRPLPVSTESYMNYCSQRPLDLSHMPCCIPICGRLCTLGIQCQVKQCRPWNLQGNMGNSGATKLQAACNSGLTAIFVTSLFYLNSSAFTFFL